MKIVLADIETDGLIPSKIHVICLRVLGTKDTLTFTHMRDFEDWYDKNRPDRWVFHNGLGFDVPVINKLVPTIFINPKDVIDTMVVSKLVDYGKFRTHSLKELGKFLGTHKGDYDDGWTKCTPAMIQYCQQDVEVLESVFNHYRKEIFSSDWAKSMRVEHNMATICHDMTTNGFTFDVAKGEGLLKAIKKEKNELEDGFKVDFPPSLVEVKRLKYKKKKKDGADYSTVVKAMREYPKVKVEGDELIVYDYKEFNPGSSIDRIDRLWEAGWKPFEKTKTHKERERETRRLR